MKALKIIFLFLLVSYPELSAQISHQKELEEKLKKWGMYELPQLEMEVDMSMSGESIQNLISALAKNSGLNIDIATQINANVYQNFANAKPRDILLLLCTKYNLDIQRLGNILTIIDYKDADIPPKIIPTRELNITYNAKDTTLNFDLKADTLGLVVKKISQLTGKGIFVSPTIRNERITAFGENYPIRKALEGICYGENFGIVNADTSTFYLDRINSETNEKDNLNPNNIKNNKTNSGMKSTSNNSNLEPTNSKYQYTIDYDLNGKPIISINAKNVSTGTIIRKLADEAKIPIVFYEEPNGNSDLMLEKVTFDQLLAYLLIGKDQSFVQNNDIYFIGKSGNKDLNETLLLQLEYRSAENILEVIPATLKDNLALLPFLEMNSIIISGPSKEVAEIKTFLKDIDKVVPVVMIDVIVIDVNKSKLITTGFTLGAGESRVPTTGTVFPDLNMTLGSQSINNLIRAINGLGVLNLGLVPSNFYASLQALESQNYMEIRSTPRLSTLNGHKATMNIGQTEYYQEITTTIVGSIDPRTVESRQFKETNADLAISILPMVSGDEQVTLDISVSISNFTSTSQNTQIPPGKANREFTSLIRVKNEEVVVLGGLEDTDLRNNSSGVPLLSRIPILKYFFSRKNRSTSKSKLVVLVKPTIIY